MGALLPVEDSKWMVLPRLFYPSNAVKDFTSTDRFARPRALCAKQSTACARGPHSCRQPHLQYTWGVGWVGFGYVGLTVVITVTVFPRKILGILLSLCVSVS